MCHLRLTPGSLRSHAISAVVLTHQDQTEVFIALFSEIQGEFKEGNLQDLSLCSGIRVQ